MRDKPYMVIDVLTDETVGWYESEFEARIQNKGKPISVIYRPGRKKKVKKN
jgi:hypothetical protein